MAKFGSYYGLCPLIDQKNLLGIAQADEEGCVIVTLGKNIAIKYKLSDQKQIQSWSTKSKFTCGVVFDEEEKKFVAIFNHAFIRMWDASDQIDKIRKIKYPLPLHTLLKCENVVVIVFKNGLLSCLNKELGKRKNQTEDIVKENETIEQEYCIKFGNNFYIGLLVKNEKKLYFIGIFFDAYIRNEIISHKRVAIERSPMSAHLAGSLIHATDDEIYLITQWSDGRLYSFPLINSTESSTSKSTLMSVVQDISSRTEVCLGSLNKSYIVLYGAEKSEEGASLILYNIQFKTTQSKHHFKIFTVGSKLWCINNYILLTVGQNLAVVPFYAATEQLSALIGSHKAAVVTSDMDLAIVSHAEVANWTGKEEPIESENIPHEIKTTIKDLREEGRSETDISEIIISEYCDKKDLKIVELCFQYFDDISENILVKALALVLKDIFNLTDYKSLIERILWSPFNSAAILPFLKVYLSLGQVLLLLQHILLYLKGNLTVSIAVDICAFEKKLLEWNCILLDAHYQSLLLSKDENSVNILRSLEDFTNSLYMCIKDFEPVQSMLENLRHKRSFAKKNVTSFYYVEQIKL